jgi:tetratricopeptide (TPR) repeat protein
LAAPSHEQHLLRFAASPDDRVAFEFLEEHLFMRAEWAALADLYRRRQAAPSLANQAPQRAELSLRLAQISEERLGDLEAAIRAYTEAVHLQPKLRRALHRLRRLYEQRGSWEAVLQIGEQEAELAESAAERAQAYVVMADVWQRHLGDREQAAQLWARARSEGWSDPVAEAPVSISAPAPIIAPVAVREASAVAEPSREARAQTLADDGHASDFETDVDLDGALASEDPVFPDESMRPETPHATLTMPDLDVEPATGEQRSTRVLGLLERKLAERESRGADLDAEAVQLRLRIAELRANSLGDPIAGLAVLEPALASASALLEVAPTLAGLYEQLGRSEPLIDLAERVASASEPGDQRVFWIRRAAECARAAGAPERAIACYERLLSELPQDRGARSALADLYRSRSHAERLIGLLREELASASRERERELELQLELASIMESLGRPSAAVPHLRRCLELEPGRPDLIERALHACALRGGPLAQLDLIEHACERADSDVTRAALLARRGTLLADTLQWNHEAAASWRAALALDPNQPLARERLAVT